MNKDNQPSVMNLIEGTTVLTNQLLDTHKEIEALKARVRELEEVELNFKQWIKVDSEAVMILRRDLDEAENYIQELEERIAVDANHQMSLPPTPNEE